MDIKKIEEKVKQGIADHLGINEDTIKLESTIADDLNADSLDELELIMLFEEEFDIEIQDEDVEEIKTVGQAVDYFSKVLE